MMDRHTIRDQQKRVKRLASMMRNANCALAESRQDLEHWSSRVGSTEGLAGAFLAGGLIGLKSAPKPPPRVVCDDTTADVEIERKGDGALMRWVNTGLLVWRLYATTSAPAATPADGNA